MKLVHATIAGMVLRRMVEQGEYVGRRVAHHPGPMAKRLAVVCAVVAAESVSSAAYQTEQIYEVLAVPGLIMICDHTPFDDSAASTALYLTEQAQQEAMAEVGFANFCIELSMNGLVLYAGERAA